MRKLSIPSGTFEAYKVVAGTLGEPPTRSRHAAKHFAHTAGTGARGSRATLRERDSAMSAPRPRAGRRGYEVSVTPVCVAGSLIVSFSRSDGLYLKLDRGFYRREFSERSTGIARTVGGLQHCGTRLFQPFGGITGRPGFEYYAARSEEPSPPGLARSWWLPRGVKWCKSVPSSVPYV